MDTDGKVAGVRHEKHHNVGTAFAWLNPPMIGTCYCPTHAAIPTARQNPGALLAQ